MEGIIVLAILIPLVCLVLLIITLSKSASIEQGIELLRNKLGQLSNQMYDLDRRLKELNPDNKTEWPPAPVKKQPVTPVVKPEPVAEPVITPPVEPTTPPVAEPAIPPAAEQPAIVIKEIVVPARQEEKAQPVSLPPKELVAETKTDWEKFIGENLANKIGITVLVLGIFFFVKFAIDKDWINETGRIIIGLVCGGLLIALAHRIRNSYRAFSSVLVGGGLTVFYFTIAFAFHQYHLISQQAAFIIMVAITVLAVVLSITYNRIELAVLATVGGFITPILVSTGQNNYIALFTYLCILNSGLLVLSWFKRWKPINIIALSFTVIIYGAWLIRTSFFEPEPFPWQWALLFATLFYLLSVAINIINNLKIKIPFGGFDFVLLLTINFLYYVAGVVILDYVDNGNYKGLFTAGLGVTNLIFSLIFFREKRVDKNFSYLLIGLALTFVSLTGPVQFEGSHVTLFWAAEAVLLFWLYQRSGIILLKICSLIILLPLLVSLFIDWAAVYRPVLALLPVMINRGFTTTLAVSAAFFLFYYLLGKEKDTYVLPGISNKSLRTCLLSGSLLFLYAAGAWEIYYQFASRLPGTLIQAAYLQLYSFAYIILILQLFKRSSYYIYLSFLLTLTGFMIYLLSAGINYQLSWSLVSAGRYADHFIVHWIAGMLLAWLLIDMIRFFRREDAVRKDYAAAFSWIISASLIFLLSIEMYHANLWINYDGSENWAYWENLYYKAGLSILWGLFSFGMMWLGMKYKFKPLRIISLSLFTITLLKLFMYDIRNIPPGGKIAAFILLGVLLLIVSFMYQRLKKILLDDAARK